MNTLQTDKIEEQPVRGISWWFTRGLVSIFTIPIALFLLLGCVGAFVQGGIQTLAYIRVLRAVFGFVGIIVFLFIWPFSLWIPGALWWATLKKIPEVIQTRAKSRVDSCGYFVAGLLFLVGLAMGMQWLYAQAIGWVADRNPTAAYEAGVTGSKLPPFMHEEIEINKDLSP